MTRILGGRPQPPRDERVIENPISTIRFTASYQVRTGDGERTESVPALVFEDATPQDPFYAEGAVAQGATKPEFDSYLPKATKSLCTTPEALRHWANAHLHDNPVFEALDIDADKGVLRQQTAHRRHELFIQDLRDHIKEVIPNQDERAALMQEINALWLEGLAGPMGGEEKIIAFGTLDHGGDFYRAYNDPWVQGWLKVAEMLPEGSPGQEWVRRLLAHAHDNFTNYQPQKKTDPRDFEEALMRPVDRSWGKKLGCPEMSLSVDPETASARFPSYVVYYLERSNLPAGVEVPKGVSQLQGPNVPVFMGTDGVFYWDFTNIPIPGLKVGDEKYLKSEHASRSLGFDGRGLRPMDRSAEVPREGFPWPWRGSWRTVDFSWFGFCDKMTLLLVNALGALADVSVGQVIDGEVRITNMDFRCINDLLYGLTTLDRYREWAEYAWTNAKIFTRRTAILGRMMQAGNRNDTAGTDFTLPGRLTLTLEKAEPLDIEIDFASVWTPVVDGAEPKKEDLVDFFQPYHPEELGGLKLVENEGVRLVDQDWGERAADRRRIEGTIRLDVIDEKGHRRAAAEERRIIIDPASNDPVMVKREVEDVDGEYAYKVTWLRPKSGEVITTYDDQDPKREGTLDRAMGASMRKELMREGVPAIVAELLRRARDVSPFGADGDGGSQVWNDVMKFLGMKFTRREGDHFELEFHTKGHHWVDARFRCIVQMDEDGNILRGWSSEGLVDFLWDAIKGVYAAAAATDPEAVDARGRPLRNYFTDKVSTVYNASMLHKGLLTEHPRGELHADFLDAVANAGNVIYASHQGKRGETVYAAFGDEADGRSGAITLFDNLEEMQAALEMAAMREKAQAALVAREAAENSDAEGVGEPEPVTEVGVA